jgi:Lrp/AsnC family transcriptional regulator for asnA, asnC and gidA
VIKGATIQVNFGHLGTAAIATLLISVDAQQIEQVMDTFEKISEIRTYRQYNSLYNIRAVATLKDLGELDQVKQTIRQKFPIKNLRTYLWTSVKNSPENLNFTGSTIKNYTNTENIFKSVASMANDEVKIDLADKLLIKKLTENGRMSFTKIAKEMKMATNTIARRYKNLKNNGTIKVSIQIDPKKLGYCAILDINLSFATPSATSQSIVETFAKIPDMIIVTKTSGDYDLQLTAMIRDINQMFSMQDEISRISSVSKFDVSARKIPERWPTPQQYISTI